MELTTLSEMRRWLTGVFKDRLGMQIELACDDTGALGEGPAITVNKIVTIEACQVKVPSIVKHRMVPGFCVYDGDDDALYSGPFIGDALLAVAAALAQSAIVDTDIDLRPASQASSA